MSSCLDNGVRNLSQICQTEITFPDSTAKYLPLEKVYVHILEKIQEAFLDLKNWDCSFSNDMTNKASTITQRDSIIRRACSKRTFNSDDCGLQHAEMPAKVARANSLQKDISTQCDNDANLLSSPVKPSFNVNSPAPSFVAVKTPEVVLSPAANPTQSSPVKSPDSTMLNPKGTSVGGFDLRSPIDRSGNLLETSRDFTLINPFLSSAFTTNKKLESIQLDDLNSLRSALSNVLKQNTEVNNLAALSKTFFTDQSNALRPPIFSPELNFAELMSQSSPQKVVPSPHTSPSSSSALPFPQQGSEVVTTTTTKTEVVSPVAEQQKEKVHQCPYCDTKFNQKSNLKTHVFGVHQFKLSTCRTCKIITSKEKLKEHMKTHPNRGFKCHQCDTSFDTHIRLLRHMKIHSSERPYKCSYCPKSFVYKWNLTEHVRIHTGEKPFVCRMCGKGFCQSSTLKRHSLAMHTMDKPYKCSQCKESFVRILLLKKHFVNHHMGTPTSESIPVSTMQVPTPPSPHPLISVSTPPQVLPSPPVKTSPDALSMLHMISSASNQP